jgi:hypothetical protein
MGGKRKENIDGRQSTFDVAFRRTTSTRATKAARDDRET